MMDPRIKPLYWQRVENGWHAETVDQAIGPADVRFGEGGWVWRYADRTAWRPCASAEEGMAAAESLYQELLGRALVPR